MAEAAAFRTRATNSEIRNQPPRLPVGAGSGT